MANNIKGLTVEISGDTTKLTEALKPVDSAAQKSASELKEINRGLKFDPGNTTLLAQKQKVLAEAIGTARQKLELLKEAEKSAQEQFARGDIGEAQMRALQREVIKAGNNLRQLESQVADLGDSAKKTGSELERSGEDIDDIGKKSDDASGKVSSFGDILKGSLAANVITDGLRAIKDGIRDITADTIDAGSSAETAMAKLATIADTEKLPLKDLQAQIMELSTKTGKSVAEIAESVYSAISGGVDTADAVAVVEKATQLASGGFTDTATAIDVLTTAINAYGLSTEDAAKLSDYLLTTQNLGKTTVDELAGSMGKVIPLASAYGVQMDNLSSAYAIMTANGIATTESTTYIKAMLKELGDSGSTVSEVLKERTGKTFAELNAEGMSLGDVLAILGDSVEGDTGKFNELWSSSEAGIGALSILGSGSERYNEVLDAMRSSAGATEAAYATMTDTFEHKSETLKNTLQTLEIEGFNGFKQSFKGAMDAVNKELQSDKTKTAVKNLGKSIGSLTADLTSAAVKVLPKLADALSFVIKNAGKLTTAVLSAVVAIKGFKIASTATSLVKSLTTAFQGFTAAVSANPFGFAITAIATLISLFSALDSAVDTDAEKLGRLSEAYRESAEAALDAQRTRANAAKEIENEYDGYRDLIEELDDIVDANGKIKEGYEDRAAYITGRLSEVCGVEIEITDGVIQKYGELSDMLDEVLLKKQAEALLTSQQGDYQIAKDAINSTETDEDGNYVAGSFRAYEAANAKYQQLVVKYQDLADEYDEYEQLWFKAKEDFEAGRITEYEYEEAQFAMLERQEAKDILDAQKLIVDNARLAYDANVAIVNNYEGLQTAVWSDDPDAIRKAIGISTNAQMQAGDAAYTSLYGQLTSQAEAYNELLEFSKQKGTTVTADQLADSEELLYRAFYEAYTAAIADGAEADVLQQLLNALINSGAVNADKAASYGDIISSGKVVSADDFINYIFNGSGFVLPHKGSTPQLMAPTAGTRFQQTSAGYMPEGNTAATQAEGAFERVLGMIQDGAGTESTGDIFSAAFDRFRELVADAPILSGELPLSVDNEATGKTNELITDLLGVVSRMDLTLVLDDGTLIARTIGKTNNALGVEVAREKRGALG